ncbi:hypothetical protein EV127DRAFT_516710 [Xylaria flabelliformis]|nr:hypothetical protein EV127DRAFT_516710 [Xylaria flabelliformis]
MSAHGFAEDAFSPIKTASFPQFSKLTKDLRLAIWGRFALPQRLYHLLRQDLNWVTDVTVSDFEVYKRRGEVRRIMQVNREARREVLRGRQLVVWDKTWDLKGRPQPGPSYSFVNWELDLFSVKFVHSHGNPWSKEPFNKIKNLAVGISGMFGRNAEQLCALKMPFFYEHDDRFTLEWREATGSVERIVLIIPCEVVWDKMHIHPALPGVQEGSFRDGRDLVMNEYGMHTVSNPTDYMYDKCKVRLVTGVEGTEEEGQQLICRIYSFSQWVHRVVPIARNIATGGRREVKCMLMLDYQGCRDPRWRGMAWAAEPLLA